ncbi:MAG: hypothetical protein M3357_03700 [Actinomycetota bacterium]|nr:hypothetical protein [Actinomycetota bacterium]
MIVRRASPGWLLSCAVLVVAAVLPTGSGAFASFGSGASATHDVSSAALSPASGLTASTSCGPLLSLTAKAELSWTVTPSAFASGYKVERWLGAVLESTASVTPRTTTALTQTGLATGTTYTWKVYSYVQGWTSSVVTVSAATPALCL